VKISTVAYKGSKRKLLTKIESLSSEINAETFFDGFSGTGIVSAHMRSKGYRVTANDLSYSSFIYGSVFLNGYNRETVSAHLDKMNSIPGKSGWITANYSGTKSRIIRGTSGKSETRPLGYSVSNAMRIDAARDYVKEVDILETEKNALVFSVILAADKVFNNSTDQKSSLKKWSLAAKKEIFFAAPTLILGPTGTQLKGNAVSLHPTADLVYLDPPYTHGVLYPSCYHLNDSIAKWDKPILDHGYAIPRPKEVCFRKNKQKSGGFYSKVTASGYFEKILSAIRCKRIVLSYSDAPRNTLTIEEISTLAKRYGKVKIESFDHRICSQPNSMKKTSTSLKEYFIVIDK
jgi:adenine-specific DNA-methyltransferase